MTKNDSIKKRSSNLRKQAEEKLQNQSTDQSNISPEQARHLLHELQVHQIELEMQNEELHRAQAELEASRTKYFNLYDLAPVGYLTIDKKGLIKHANFTATQLLGVERSFVVKKPLTHFIYRDDQDVHYLHLKKLFDTGLPQEYELRFVKKDGSQFSAFLKSTAVQEEDSGSIVCQTALIDISKRKRVEEELKQTTDRFRILIHNLRSGVALIDERGRFVIVNQSFLRIFDLSEESDIKNVNDRNWADWQVFGENGMLLDVDEHPVRKAAMTGKAVRNVLVGVRAPSGLETKWILISAEPIFKPDGRLEATICTYQDITNRKQIEEELNRYREHLEEIVMQRTQELQDKNLQLIQAQRMEALGKLAGGIAHDLNNILQPILLNSEMISDKLPAGTQEREYLDQIIDAAQLGRTLIKQIKSFGSSLNPILKPIPISQVIHKALTLVKRTLSPNINLHHHISMNGYLVYADSTQINQLVLNLCTNAAQAMSPKGGTLDVSLDENEITQATPAIGNDLNPGKHMKLTVSDTGSGIKPEIMKDIFDPFFTTRKAEGTGLGLAIVYSVVKNSQSSMLVYSEVGKGTRFEIFFPLHLDSLD